MKQLLAKVILEIMPDKAYEKEIMQKANHIVKTINKGLKGAKATIGGSAAKGTWLKNFDADIFVQFSYANHFEKNDQLSTILEAFLKKHFTISKIHGSRDYFQIKDDHYTFEIIPILKITKASQAKNITDVSPLHARYVNKHRILNNEIRIAKQFFKAAHVYGAESHIKGFSGYVCELLTIHYGSFQKLIKAIAQWKDPVVIDIENCFKGKDIFMELNKSKLQSPIVIIDPVQSERNAAAAVSSDAFNAIRKRAQAFLRNPLHAFFEVTATTEEDLKKQYRGLHLYTFRVRPLERKADIAGAKLLKSLDYIANILQRNDFQVKAKGMVWGTDSSILYIVVKNIIVPKTKEYVGPFLSMSNHVAQFKKQHKKTYIKGKRVMATITRKHTMIDTLIHDIIKDKNLLLYLAKISVS